jgi:hypothetical protein
MDLISEYDNKLDQYIKCIPNYKYIFEVTKLCGHGEFLTVYKNQTLLDLYKTISLQYECKNIKRLFFINKSTGEQIDVPITEQITINDFILNLNSGSNSIISPIYPIPCKIVYKIYFDDGHTHGNVPCKLIF